MYCVVFSLAFSTDATVKTVIVEYFTFHDSTGADSNLSELSVRIFVVARYNCTSCAHVDFLNRNENIWTCSCFLVLISSSGIKRKHKMYRLGNNYGRSSAEKIIFCLYVFFFSPVLSRSVFAS